MRIAPRSSRFAIFSCRALTASATEAASADKSSGPPVVARNPTWLGSTKIEIVMATTNAQGLRLPLLYSISQVMRSESARPKVSSDIGDRKRDRYDIDNEEAESGTGTILTRWGVLDYGSAMPRTARVAPGGMVFHVLNRGVARMQLFEKAADYQAFEQVLRDTLDQSPMRICAYAVMPNHWHLLLWPECDGELAAFMQRLTITHVRRWQEHRGMRDWAMSTKVDTKRSRWRATSISGLWPDTLSATRCAPISSCERRNGGGQACGNAVILREKSGRC